MSIYISEILNDQKTVTCGVCNTVFNTDEITLDDYHFAWDNVVETDCCNDCFFSVLVESEKDLEEKYIVDEDFDLTDDDLSCIRHSTVRG
jgi:hypothetical protein|tara:strand:- start:151 stop:420 length:270 start_codon:yes stop_codon:yes gene_type:complete